MHACGHDVHSSVVLGTALVLHAPQATSSRARVTFLFQPAEEGPPEGEDGGADLMVREGALDDPPVRAVFGFHVWPENRRHRPLRPGQRDRRRRHLRHRRSRAGAPTRARPHEGVDAVVIAAEIVTALQTVVSRASDPTDPAVLTVGTINGGTRRNIIADRVVLEGTVRTLSDVEPEEGPPAHGERRQERHGDLRRRLRI
ncbi:MAG: M20/M25/M40 family metallo-hydrolase [Ignavibacteriales bacterium]|nr:M20/M25/M40 family metallo-hydrolase [Ignavibacteriales bacterium]